MARILRPLLIAVALASGADPALAGDAAKGKAVFQGECAMCHSVTAHAPGIGPTLFGAVGRKAGSLAGYSYSNAMKGAGFVWSQAKLDTYLFAPQKVVPGDKMPYAGLTNPAKRADLIAYLATLK
jgi:cytochrome c